MKMTTCITILRGINVSGQKLIKMEILRKLMLSLGFTDVETYIQSGNLVFKSSSDDTREISKLIADGILKEFGFEVPVITLSWTELNDIAADNPFLRDESREYSSLYITYLESAPSEENAARFNDYSFPGEEFFLGDRAVYLCFPNGYGKAKINNNFIESKLKVSATTRNLKTTDMLVEMGRGGE